jgi:hypothetical protein
MGRTLKRVSLDFDWPLNKTWIGYVNPYSSKKSTCCYCDGVGLAPEAKRFYEQWYGNEFFDPVAYGAEPIARDHPKILAMAERNVRCDGLDPDTTTMLVRLEVDRLYWNCFLGHWNHHLIQADVDALIAEDRLWDFTRVPRTKEQIETVKQKVAAGGNSWLPESNLFLSAGIHFLQVGEEADSSRCVLQPSFTKVKKIGYALVEGGYGSV